MFCAQHYVWKHVNDSGKTSHYGCVIYSLYISFLIIHILFNQLIDVCI